MGIKKAEEALGALLGGAVYGRENARTRSRELDDAVEVLLRALEVERGGEYLIPGLVTKAWSVAAEYARA